MTTSLGKRSVPGGATLNPSKKRTGFDSKHARETADTNCVSGQAGDADAGNWAKFPEIPEKTAVHMVARGYKTLFPIQQHCFRPLFNREDVIARDLTGSGKTLAFGLPLIEYLRKNKLLGSGKVQAVILAPTRELALQITAELTKMKYSPEEFRIVTVYGGVSVMD